MYSQQARAHRAQIYSTSNTQLATQINTDRSIHHSHRHKQHQKCNPVPLSSYMCVCVCVFVYIYLCVSMYTYTYVPGGSLQQLSLPSLPWIWPLQLLAPGLNSPQGHSPTPVAGTDHCTHIQKDTHASRYPNRLPDPMIPPAALWDSPGPFDSHLLL